MPVNAPAEYFKAEEHFHRAKTQEEKIAALEEMIRLLPRHHGSENAHAQLRSKLAKLRKEGAKSKKTTHKGIQKEGEAQVCLFGIPNSGKSTLLSHLTDAKPKIAYTPYTTTKPVIGMLDYRGVKIQIIEIPPTFEPEYLSIVRSAEIVLCIARNETERAQVEKILNNAFIRTKRIFINPWKEKSEEIKESIWKSLGLIIAYTKKSDKSLSPMALPKNSSVRDFAARIHKDFITHFRFARLWRKNDDVVMKQVGLGYRLADGDIVEIHVK